MAKSTTTSTQTIGAFVIGALFLASPLVSRHLNPNDYQGGRARNEIARTERNTSALATILGELRTSASDMMFVKTERYLHNGVAYMPHMEEDEVVQTGEEGHKSHAGGTPTVIPSPQDDFRGIVGELERKVKPWLDPTVPHELASGTELLPWYRLMTVSDPHYVRGYQIGGWWLKANDPNEGVKFLEEGIQNNPEAFQLPYIKGLNLMVLGKMIDANVETEDPEARRFYRRAAVAFREGADLIERNRPDDYDRDKLHDDWTEYQEEDARSVARMAILMEDRLGNKKHALRLAKKYNDVLQGDGILERNIARMESELAESESAE